jgi:hypothetical protein
MRGEKATQSKERVDIFYIGGKFWLSLANRPHFSFADTWTVQSINDHLHPLSCSQKNQWSQEVAGLVLTHRLHGFIKDLQSWAMWNHKTTREKTEKHPAATIYSWVKFWAGSTKNFNQPKLWHAVCTILEGPLGSFLSTSNHNHLPRCSLVQHKCKESNGLILCWLKFAPMSLLQIFSKVGSLVALLLSTISSHMFMQLCGSMQQQEKCSSSNHHMRMLLTYHHVFYVKLGMSQTPKLWFHVLECISSVMNIWPQVIIVWLFKFAQRLLYHDFLLRWVNLMFFLIAIVFTCISLG